MNVIRFIANVRFLSTKYLLLEKVNYHSDVSAHVRELLIFASICFSLQFLRAPWPHRYVTVIVTVTSLLSSSLRHCCRHRYVTVVVVVMTVFAHSS